ncbi:MAG: sugar phosphate nucleotidyltransferase [Oligoflexia bacterium]|nr:sugar phosphate nucleotidyltransferase [Oligoflexia bacterium]
MGEAENLFLVIMAGGSGTRFWPKSTARKPKQLLSFGKRDGESGKAESESPSLLGMTLARFDGIVPRDQRLIVTTKLLGDAVAGQAAGATVLQEPQGRNTAPCIYWAAREIAKRDPRGVMLVMPADHYIAFPERFRETVRQAARWAATHDDLVALGVKPARPETGYGYLRIAPGVLGEKGCRKVEAFVEKPALEKAREFVSSGRYLWNGGMFLWRAEVILAAFDRHMPEMEKAWTQAQGEIGEAYPRMTATSIDYGVMEKADNVVSFPLDCGWDDVGSWTSLEGLADALGARHEAGTVVGGEALSIDASGNIVDVPGKVAALLGVKDLIIVQQGEVLLVADKNRAQDIKLIVEQVKLQKPHLA